MSGKYRVFKPEHVYVKGLTTEMKNTRHPRKGLVFGMGIYLEWISTTDHSFVSTTRGTIVSIAPSLIVSGPGTSTLDLLPLISSSVN